MSFVITRFIRIEWPTEYDGKPYSFYVKETYESETIKVDGIEYRGYQILVHWRVEKPANEECCWRMPGPDLYFDSLPHATDVFLVLYGRAPDPGSEILRIEYTPAPQMDVDPGDHYYGCPEHQEFGDRWYFNDYQGEL